MDRRKFMAAAGAVILGRTGKTVGGTDALSAFVTVDPEPLHRLPHTQYGHFLEHLGKCIKGGVWAEGESDDMFLGGVRWELVEAMRSLKPPCIRYPGGCFADGYHWRDGVGPRDSRPIRKNRAWARQGQAVGPMDDNRFGTDEFMALCEEVGADPMLTVNVGSGTAEEAARWVEYCNGPAKSGPGAERARNGHPEPYNVKYWFVGNEIFSPGEIGSQRPRQYVETFNTFARAMRAADPDVKLIAVGNFIPEILGLENAGMSANKTVLEGAGAEADYLSIHQYVPQWGLENLMRFGLGDKKTSGSEDIYYEVISMVQRMQYVLERSVRDVKTYSPAGKLVPVAFDEWNLWFDSRADLIQANYNLRDGLWTATMLNLLHRLAPYVPIANYAQMVNCLGMIWSDKDATFLTASGQAFKLYSNHAGEEFLGSTVQSPPIPHKSSLPALDFSATRSGSRLALFLVNRHYDSELEVSCLLRQNRSSRLFAWEMHHHDPARYNTVQAPAEVTIKEKREGVAMENINGGTRLTVLMKPHSLACVELEE